MTDKIRDVIVHYHIFKNAGTTVDAILHAGFPETNGAVEGKYPWDTLTSQELLDYILANPTLEVVSSHQARLPLPEHPGLRIHPILFLRHPIDRVESVYHFERRQAPDSLSPSVRIAQSTDLKGFVEWGLSDEGTAVFRNFQTICLAGRERDMRTARATNADYLVASARLRELPFVGVVDRFEESARAMKRNMHFAFPHIAFHPGTAQNRSEGRATSLSKRLEHIALHLGDTVFDRVLNENRFDLELYMQSIALGLSGKLESRHSHAAELSSI
ncbi:MULTISPECIES: sulfotransferase family 2 domain-containing protein [unclassified Cupriavidus]|jgi:hypothetical protein|uniref:sulfotransferase family 2 domain-containing protein n=1 Tax=unclassified Cupriavidus TaxID=2640874 RepID=UPI000A5EB676|nr:sulfotransferase family 2 domain-containing protein [Cupriavidus sp. SK-3]